MPVLLAALAALILLAALAAAWALNRRHRAWDAAADRRAQARVDLAVATGQARTIEDRLARTLAADTAEPGGGFGDTHVRAARLRAALTEPTAETL